MTRRARRTFTQDFKTQIVNLYLGGKNKADILRDYDLHAPTLDRWIKRKRQIITVFKNHHVKV